MPEPTTTTLALAVWPPPPASRRGSYLAATTGKHRIAPDLAARAILAYSNPGDLIIDPDCAVGTVLIEAIQQGRRAIGVTPDRDAAALATANLSHARHHGAPGRGAVIEGNPDLLPHLLGKAAAILNPTGDRTSRVRRHPAGSAQLLLTRATAGLTCERLSSWARAVSPGGFLLLVHTQTATVPHERLGAIVAAAEAAGLQYWQHVIALRTGQTGGALLHDSVLSFRKPGSEAATSRTTATVRAVAA